MTKLDELLGPEQRSRIARDLAWQIFRGSDRMVPQEADGRAELWIQHIERHHPAAEAAEILSEHARGESFSLTP